MGRPRRCGDVGGQRVKDLDGKTSDRIRSGEIPPEALAKGRVETFEEMPDIEYVKHGGGRGLGQGATRKRNGGAS